MKSLESDKQYFNIKPTGTNSNVVLVEHGPKNLRNREGALKTISQDTSQTTSTFNTKQSVAK
jgi:hypothetical protein